MAHLADKACLLIALLAPPLLVFRFNRLGIILGALTVWASLLLASFLLGILDPPSRNSWTTFFDLVWIATGWLVGLLYCLIFYGLKLLYLRARRPTAP